MAALSIIGIIYGALVAMAQKDMKKLVAYSSVTHLGFVMLGLFALNGPGLNGGILQMINHGLSTGALFLLVGIIYERRHTRLIAEYGGLSAVMPLYATIFLIITMSSIGLPTLNGFIGEFTILVGAFQRVWWWAPAGGLGIVLGAAYMLWMYQRVFFGPLTNPENKELKDLDGPRDPLSRCRWSSSASGSASIRSRSSACSRGRSTTSWQRWTRRTATAVAAVGQPPRRPRPRQPRRRGSSPCPCPILQEFLLLAPEILLAAAGLLLLLAGAIGRGMGSRESALVAIVSLGLTAAVLVRVHSVIPGRLLILNGSFVLDGFSFFWKMLVLVATALTVLLSVRFLEEGNYRAAGVLLAAPARHLGHAVHGERLHAADHLDRLETMALASYILAGYFKRELRSNEAALKYFILGALSARHPALRHLAALRRHRHGPARRALAETLRSASQGNPLVPLGWLMLAAGLFFKVAAVPFHIWTPDVYVGAPTPVTAWLAVASKAASFAILLRIFYEGLGEHEGRVADGGGHRRGGHHDLGQPGRADAGQRQADARLQLDRPRRLRADRRAGGLADRPVVGDLLPAGLHLHHPGRLRHGDPAGARASTRARLRRTTRASRGARRSWRP